MSHFAGYKVKVSNMEFVKKALGEMGLGYRENDTIIDWAKQKRKVDLSIVKDGKLLPLGFARNKEKEIEVIADWFMLEWTEKQFTNRVSQLHDKYMTLDMCEQNNWNVSEEDITVNKNGEIEILATQWA